MRLNPVQIEAILHSAHAVFGSGVEVFLFGSRVNDEKRGGDIDLLIRPSTISRETTLMNKINFLSQLERKIGERKVDVVIETPNDDRPIVHIAHQTGVRL